MNTMVKRIASWFVPATIALAICPTAAIAEGPQSEATAADTDQIEQTQDVAANSASTNIIQTQGPDGTDPIGGSSDAQNSGQQPTEQVNNGLVLENGHLINYADGTEKPFPAGGNTTAIGTGLPIPRKPANPSGLRPTTSSIALDPMAKCFPEHSPSTDPCTTPLLQERS